MLYFVFLVLFATVGRHSQNLAHDYQSGSIKESDPASQSFPTSLRADLQDKTADQDAASRRQSPQASQTEGNFIDTTSSFRGWRGEAAVMRQEDILDSGSDRASFYSISQDGKQTQLSPAKGREAGRGEFVQDPAGLRPGKIFVLGHDIRIHDPAITLQIDCDDQKVQALQRAIADWEPGKELPEIPAKLKLLWVVSGHNPTILWRDSRMLTAVAGEASYEYSPPSLSLAVLSPSGRTLLVGLTIGNEEEYHMIVMPAGTTEKIRPAASK